MRGQPVRQKLSAKIFFIPNKEVLQLQTTMDTVSAQIIKALDHLYLQMIKGAIFFCTI